MRLPWYTRHVYRTHVYTRVRGTTRAGRNIKVKTPTAALSLCGFYALLNPLEPFELGRYIDYIYFNTAVCICIEEDNVRANVCMIIDFFLLVRSLFLMLMMHLHLMPHLIHSSFGSRLWEERKTLFSMRYGESQARLYMAMESSNSARDVLCRCCRYSCTRSAVS